MPRNTFILACLAISTCLSSASLRAQALATEQKSADFQIGGSFSGAHPDYTQHTFYGPGAYFDFDMRHHIGIEGSVNFLNYPAPLGIKEQTYQIGVRYNFANMVRRVPPRVNPYLRITGGRGIFNYGTTSLYNAATNTYSAANNADLAYTMYTFGGGIEYRLNRAINIRVLDYEYQHWTGFPPHGLTPVTLTAGVAYHFH